MKYAKAYKKHIKPTFKEISAMGPEDLLKQMQETENGEALRWACFVRSRRLYPDFPVVYGSTMEGATTYQKSEKWVVWEESILLQAMLEKGISRDLISAVDYKLP